MSQFEIWTRVSGRTERWYARGPNLYLATGLISGPRGCPTIGVIRVERERQGTGTAVFLEIMKMFKNRGSTEFEIDSINPHGEALIDSLIRKNVIKQLNELRFKIVLLRE